MSRTRVKTPKLTAAQLARQEVAQLFDAMLEDRAPEATLNQAFDRVTKILQADHVREHGPIKDEAEYYLIALDAGYLIGVQVGLRLRNVGGVR